MSDDRRLFFAVEVPDAIRQEIIDWRARHFPDDTGRPVAAASLHLTLAFLGEVSAAKSQALCAQDARIRQPGFSINLDDAGHWPRSRVVWVGPRRAERGLLQLASLLRAQAARSGCPQRSLPFLPHITLWRQARHDIALPAPGFLWRWQVDSFTLFESQFQSGRVRYRALESWTLSQ